MDRRKALKVSSIVLGYTITAGTAAAVLNGCKADPALDWSPSFLNANQANLISEISEMIIPKTDTPGAKDAMVDRFVDSMLETYAPEDREQFMEGLVSFDNKANSLFSKSFVDCAAMMREATVVGFCNSEVGATKFLKYDPVPGPFVGCVEYNTVGGAWAL